MTWCSPIKLLNPQESSHSKPHITWDKDGNPYLPGVRRAKSLLFSELVTLEQFIPSLLEIELTQTYLPHARPFIQRAGDDVLPGSAKPPTRIKVRCSTVATQTSPIQMWHMATQTFEMIMPTPISLVGEKYWPEDLGFGQIDMRSLHPPTVPGIQLSLLSPVELPASSNLTLAMPLYHMLLEVS